MHIIPRRWAALVIILCMIGAALAVGPISAQQPPSTVTRSGILTITYGDPEPGTAHPPQTLIQIVDSAGQATRLSVPLGSVFQFRNQAVVIQGTLLADPSGVQVLSVSSIAPDPRLQQGTVPPPAVTGAQPFINVLCRFSDLTGTTPVEPSFVEGLFSNTYPNLDHYWRTVSYNTITLVGTSTVGWFNLPQTQAYYTNNGNPRLTELANDCTAAADDQVNFPSFVGINLFLNGTIGCCAWGGTQWLNRDGVFKGYRMTWLPPWGYTNNVNVIAHEMGHGWGWPHSSSPYPSNQRYPYDSKWDIMSDAFAGSVPQGTISFHLDDAGWVGTARKVTVEVGSQVVVTLDRLQPAVASSNPLMAIVNLPNQSSRFYTVEARQKTPGDYEQAIPGTAVVMHDVALFRQETAQVVDPDNNGNANDAGAMWVAGESFTDPANKIRVSVLNATDTGFRVLITNGSYNPRQDTVGVFRPSNATFYLRNTNTTGPADISFVFGTTPDLPVAGDWDGDGVDSVGLFRPSTGQWFLKDGNSFSAPVAYTFWFGANGDLPVAGDWNGDGKDSIGVFRAGRFLLRDALTTGGANYAISLGTTGDLPVAGDWDGDGTHSPGVYRPPQARFFLTNTVCANCVGTVNNQFTLGIADDVPLAGDWDADGLDSGGVFRPSNGRTYLRNALTTGTADISMIYGIANDRPIAGKWVAGTPDTSPEAPSFEPPR